MNAGGLIAMDTDTLGELISYLRNTGSQLSLSAAASQAIRAWLADRVGTGARAIADTSARAIAGAAAAEIRHPEYAQNTATADASLRRDSGNSNSNSNGNGAGDDGVRGYQWKELFLPDGCELRMVFDGGFHHARVCDNAIIYQGRQCSPRQLTIAIAGNGRNAWRDLRVRFPGERQYRPASLLRRRLQATLQAELAPGDPATNPSPAATIAAAAAAMSEALRTALALVDHSNAQALTKYERRIETHHRRGADLLGEQALLD